MFPRFFTFATEASITLQENGVIELEEYQNLVNAQQTKIVRLIDKRSIEEKGLNQLKEELSAKMGQYQKEQQQKMEQHQKEEQQKMEQHQKEQQQNIDALTEAQKGNVEQFSLLISSSGGIYD
uniref:Uncharacterized protein n=1 Tax=Globodera pallida TaxID=36090 RepID=A0A183C056_GLOPA